jgi:hypothetical protein
VASSSILTGHGSTFVGVCSAEITFVAKKTAAVEAAGIAGASGVVLTRGRLTVVDKHLAVGTCVANGAEAHVTTGNLSARPAIFARCTHTLEKFSLTSAPHKAIWTHAPETVQFIDARSSVEARV